MLPLKPLSGAHPNALADKIRQSDPQALVALTRSRENTTNAPALIREGSKAERVRMQMNCGMRIDELWKNDFQNIGALLVK